MPAGTTGLSLLRRFVAVLSLDPQRRVTPPEESDYTHYAFSISEADFASFAARLEAAGVAIWKLNRSEGASHYFLDPDGHKLELHVGSLAQRLAACLSSRIRVVFLISGCFADAESP